MKPSIKTSFRQISWETISIILSIWRTPASLYLSD